MFDDTTARLLLVAALLSAASLWFVVRRRGDGRFRQVATSRGASRGATRDDSRDATLEAARPTVAPSGRLGSGSGTHQAPLVPENGRLRAEELGEPLGVRATFVQFSTTTCAACPQVSRTLAGVARAAAGVAHVEVAAQDRMDLVRRFGITRTPTVLLVGPTGEVWSRAAGPMDAQQALSALRARLGSVAHA